MFIAPTALPEDPATLQQILRAALAEIERLRLMIAALRRNRFGRRSEQLDDATLQQGVEDAEQALAEQMAALDAVAPASTTPEAKTASRPARSAPAKRNRGALPAELPRVEQVIDVEDKLRPCCGGALHLIGEDRTEMLDYIPAQFRVTRRPRCGCRACEEAVVQAPAPKRPIDGGMATEALLAHVLVNKYADHLPLYRQSQSFSRQGVTLDRSTLCNWLRAGAAGSRRKASAGEKGRRDLRAALGRACWWLAPLHQLILSTVLSSPKSSPTTPHCRCSIPGGDALRPDGCGATRWIIGLGVGRATLPRLISIVKIARASPCARICGGSVACCRSMAMPGSPA